MLSQHFLYFVIKQVKVVSVIYNRKKTYLCFTVVTVSAATLVVMFFAATSNPVHMVAKPEHTHIWNHKKKSYFSSPLREYNVWLNSTLHSAGSYHHGPIYVGTPILIFLHRLWDEFASVFFYMWSQLPTHAAGNRTHSVHCGNTTLLN